MLTVYVKYKLPCVNIFYYKIIPMLCCMGDHLLEDSVSMCEMMQCLKKRKGESRKARGVKSQGLSGQQ